MRGRASSWRRHRAWRTSGLPSNCSATWSGSRFRRARSTSTPCPIHVHAPAATSLDSLLAREDNGIHAFGKLAELCQPKPSDAPRERLARQLHEAYLRRRRADTSRPVDAGQGALREWDELAETYRRSNRPPFQPPRRRSPAGEMAFRQFPERTRAGRPWLPQNAHAGTARSTRRHRTRRLAHRPRTRRLALRTATRQCADAASRSHPLRGTEPRHAGIRPRTDSRALGLQTGMNRWT